MKLWNDTEWTFKYKWSKNLIFSVIICSPSQNNDEFDTFLCNIQMLLNDISKCKPSLLVVTGDFNSRCSSWWSNDINFTERLNLFTLTSLMVFVNKFMNQHTAITKLYTLAYIYYLNTSIFTISHHASK